MRAGITLLFISLGVAVANTAWTVCKNNRKLLKDGKLFFIRGVNYQPVPIGGWSGRDLLLNPSLWQRDLAILRNMNVNAVKVYQMQPGNFDGHKVYLDAAYNNGHQPIYTMFSIWVSEAPMRDWVGIDSPDFQKFVSLYWSMAKEVACHPGTMGFVIGGEMNGIWEVNTPLYWAKFNQLSQAVRQGIEAAKCSISAPKILTTNFLDDYGTSIVQGEKYGADVDIWGVNIYDKRFNEQKMMRFGEITSRPYLFAEYGVPFASNNYKVTGSATWDVGAYLLSLANLLRDSFLGKNPSGLSLLVGGFVFEYTDEWWKQGSESTQEFGWDAGPIFPLQYFSEEYFGLFSVERGNGLDVLTPRLVVAQLASLWALPTDGQPYDCIDPSKISFPKTTPARTLTTCANDLVNGVSFYSDTACAGSNGAYGCQGSGGQCRYCQLFYTPQNSQFVGCPAPASPKIPANTCTNSSLLCSNGVALQPDPKSCKFDTCPVTTCDADPVMLARGVGMVYDPECLVNEVFVGCDQLRPGCRYCSPPNSKTAFVPCPVLPAASPCTSTLSDLNMGIGIMEDSQCVVGGIGCDATRPTCRYCKMRDTIQSRSLNACPGVTISSTSNFQAMDDSTSDGASSPNSNSTGLIAIAFVVIAILLGVLFLKEYRRRKQQQSRRKSQVALHTPSDPSIL